MSTKTNWLKFLSLLVILSLALTACGSPAPTASETVTLSRVEYDALMKKVDNLEKQVADLQSTATAVPTKAAATFTPSTSAPTASPTNVIWRSDTATPSMTPKPSATYISPTPTLTLTLMPADWKSVKIDKTSCAQNDAGIDNAIVFWKGEIAKCIPATDPTLLFRFDGKDYTITSRRLANGTTFFNFNQNTPDTCTISQGAKSVTLTKDKMTKNAADKKTELRVEATNANISVRCVATGIFDVTYTVYVIK